MIVGIGVDIVEIARIEKAVERARFWQRTYTESERLELTGKPAESAAARFAGKEAVAKALGTGFRGFWPEDIEIVSNEAGKPVVNLYRGAKDAAATAGVQRVHISLSHDGGHAVAFAVAEG